MSNNERDRHQKVDKCDHTERDPQFIGNDSRFFLSLRCGYINCEQLGNNRAEGTVARATCLRSQKLYRSR